MRCGDLASLVRYHSNNGSAADLTPQGRRDIEQHLAGCPSCAKLAEQVLPALDGMRLALARTPARTPNCPEPNLLRDYVQRRLPRFTRAGLRSHLIECEPCLRRVHFLSAAPVGPESGRIGGWLGMSRRVWLTAAIAAPGYLLALLALTGRLPVLPRAEQGNPAAVAVARQNQALPATGAPQGIAANDSRGQEPEATPSARQTARQKSDAAPPPVHTAGTGAPFDRRRAGGPAARGHHPGGAPPTLVPSAENLLYVQALDLALTHAAAGIRPSLLRARELVITDRLNEAAGVLSDLIDGDPEHSLGASGCLAMLHLASPGRDRLAIETLARAAGSDRLERGGDDETIRIVQLAAGLAPRGADRAMQRVQAYQEDGDLPLEALILAGIVLDQPAYRDQSRAVLRAARNWLERDLKARESVANRLPPAW
jgi:hypothetical protein